MRILLLEDDRLFAGLVEAQLRRMPGLESRLEVLDSLAEAIARLAAGSFDLIVTDLNLPDSKGLGTVQALARAGDQPIIVLSGDATPALRAGVIEAGAYDFLQKDQLSAAALDRLVRVASLHADAFRALRESESRFRSLINLSSDFYWESDAEHRITNTEHGSPRHPAVNPAQLGKARWDMPSTHPEAEGWAAHRATMQAHRPFQDFEVARLDGDTERWRSLSGQPVFDEKGAFKGYRGIGKDITERKHAEEALRRFRLALDTSPDMILLIDRKSMRYIDVNTTACRLMGYTREELLAGGPQDTSRLSRSELETLYDRMIADPSAVTGLRSDYRCKDGSLLPFESTRRVLRSGGRWIIAIIARDIRAHLEAEKALAEGEARFRSLTALSSDWYWEQDEQLRLIFMSSIEKLGLDAADYMGKHRWDQPALNLTEADWARHRAQLERHEPFRDFEIERPAPHGRNVWVALSGEPVFGAGGRFAGYRGVGRNITQRKRAQQLRELEHTVTRSLAEADSVSGALQGSIRAVCSTEGWECGRYFAADGKAGVLRFSMAWGVEDEPVQRFIVGSREITYAKGEGLAGRVWQTGQPLWITDISEDGRSGRPALSRASGMRGAFIFPVIAEGATIGVLTFNTRDRRQLEEDLMQAIGVIGSQIGQFVQRKQAEAQRHVLEVQFRRTFELAGTGLAHIGLDRNFIRVNRRLCEIFGYAEAELLGRAAKEFSHPDDLDVINEQRPRLYAGEIDAVRGEKRYLRKDGSTVWLAYAVAVERDARGQPLYEITAYDDVTDRKRAEQRQAAHLRYQERVARFGQSALVKSEPAELIERAVQAVLEALAADAVGYLEAGPAASELVLRAVVGIADAGASPAPVACAQGDPILQVLGSGKRVLVDGARLPLAWARGLRSAALLPVRSDNKVRGVLCVFYRQPDALGAEELNFVEAMASLLSTALQRIDSEGRLAYLAQFDPLTGLPNRTLLADRFSQMLVQAKRRGSPLAVLFIDLDEFKVVNDTLGHAGGDALLKEVAVRLQSAVRSGDTVARISGDEFAIVLADLERADDAALVAQKVIDRLAATVDIAGKEVFVTASVGIAAFPGDGTDAESLIGAADAAMYRAKQSGRNVYQFYTAEINQRSRARAQMSAELRRALERDEFALFYQPKVDLASRGINGAEALLRWRHPERGLVAPMEFIPVLEETGLIVQVGDWVLQRACDDLKAWQAAGLAVVPIAVNLSARQFRHADLDARVQALVASAAIDPGLIELEITESQLMHDPAHAIRVMRALREAGMRIAIDDFGTGYSSLAYLRRFPVSALKIDRSFVKDMAKSKDDATIVRTIIEMAHSLGFTVVAEGVETEEQADSLRRLRCEAAQGYLFARPMPAGELIRLLAKR